MANQKTYTIEIAGVKESYESVSKLADVLDKLTDKTVKVSTEIDKQAEAVGNNTKQVQQSTKATDELGKATKKLQEFDADYEKEVQRVKSELSAQKKEVSELIKQEQAQAVVDEKQLNSYADKQKYLTSLNKLIRTHANVTDEDKEEIRAMVEESAKLQAELKAFDEEMKIYTRNVGNYPGAAQMVIDANKSIKQELRELTTEMANMLANGVSKTDPQFQSLAKRAGELKDAMADAGDEIKHFASDTRGLDNVINLAQTATSVWGLYSNAMEAFGIENKKVEESMKQMMAVMSTLQELQTLQNALTAQGSATMKVYETVVGGVTKMLGLNTTATQASTAATNGLSTAQKAGAVASKTLSVALRAIPLMFIIGLVVTLITEWQSIWNWFRKTFPVVDTLSKKFKQFGGVMNTLKAVFAGFGNAVINWVVNPLKTMANVISKVLSGDFSGAMTAVTQGIRNQFKGTADAFNNVFHKQVDKGLEEITLKSLEEGNKQTKQELEELKIRERNNKTYSKKYIELQKKDFEERKKLAKGNKDELNKIKLEEMQFNADCEDKITAYTEQQQKARTKAAKAHAQQRKKIAEDAAKEYQKELQELIKKIDDDTKNGNELVKNGVELNRKQIEDNLKALQKRLEEFHKKSHTEIQEALLRRKMLVYNTFAEEALQTKQKYLEVISSLNDDILKATKKGLNNEVKELNETLTKVKSNFKLLFGDYDEEDFKIPLSFDEDEIISRYKEMLRKFGKDGKISLDDTFSLLTDFEEKINKLFTNPKTQEDIEHFTDKFFQMTEILTGTTDGIDKVREAYEKIHKNTFQGSMVRDLILLEQFPEGFERTKKTIEEVGNIVGEKDKIFKAFAKDASNVLFGTNLVIDQMGVLAEETKKKIKDLTEESTSNIKKLNEDAQKEIISTADKILNYYDKVIKKFQEAAKGLKLEIVNVDDAFTKTFGGQIMSIDKTRKRYKKLKDAYLEYDKALEENKGTEQWNKKLAATKKLYGEDSVEYKLMLDEKAKADAEYLMEHEKVQQQIQQIDKKTNELEKDYAESLGKRIEHIYKAFSENMFEPLAEGFTALLDYQIEEAEKRLEDVEELLDKAVELREDSEEKIEEINNKLKESDKGNTEALKQQLADEMVLLVQRQQNERDLQKQKEREEALIKKKEKQQRKIELGQKLIEGIVNTAVGVTAALRYGIPLGPIFASIIGAMGALQTGIIIKQMSKLEKGGLLKGKSHKQGGMRVEGTNIEVEGGEYVVNKKSTTKYINLIEAINEDNPIKVRRLSNRFENGGVMGKPTTIINNYHNTPLVSSSIRKFADGGQLNYGQSVAAIEKNSDAYRVTQAIENMNFEPVVSVVDIQKKTNSLTKVKDLAGKG